MSLLRVLSNEDMAREERAEVERALQARQNEPVILGLAAYLRRCWDAAHRAKQPIEHVMLRSQRQRNGEYEADKLGAIRQQGGSEVFMQITEVKCRAAESWLRDILFDQGLPPWDLHPTTLPDLPPDAAQAIDQAVSEMALAEIEAGGGAPTPAQMAVFERMAKHEHMQRTMQEAKDRAERMQRRIQDQFEQGGWADAFSDFISDLATYPAAFLKGPVVRRQRALAYTMVNGELVVHGEDRLAPEFERVDPYRIYPEPGIRNIQDGYLFEHHRMSRSALADLIGVPNYDDAAIRALLAHGGNRLSWFTDVSLEEQNDAARLYDSEMTPTDMYDALEFWGKVSGKMLIEWGMTEDEIPDPAREYDANVWLVGNYVIKAVLNYDPLGEKPYVKTSFIKQPGSFWGRGIPEVIADIQDVCNAAVRSMVNNMALASGPQVEVNLDRLAPNEPLTQLYPWRIWQVLSTPLGTNEPAVRFSQPDSRASELMAVYDRYARLSDDHSGIPAYIYGDLNVSGAGRTASGLSMLMGSAGKGIRQVVMYIDHDVIHPIVRRQFVYNMRFDPDMSIKGDVDIVPRGALNLATREVLNTRRIEFLQATANPVDMELVGPEGRAAILREIAKGLQMPAEDIVPTRDALQKAQRDAAAANAAQNMAPAGQQAVGATPEFPGGTPMGGRAANTVSQ